MRHFKVLSSNIYNYHAQRHLLDDFTGLELNQHFPYYFGRSHHIKLPDLLNLPMDGLEPPACPLLQGPLSRLSYISIWWTLPDLNRSPQACKASALPDELRAQIATYLCSDGVANHPRLCLTNRNLKNTAGAGEGT